MDPLIKAQPGRIALLIRELDRGGTQRQLVALATGLKKSGYDVHVVQFYSGGIFEPELLDNDIPLHSIGKQGRWDTFGFLLRLTSCLRELKPAVIYSFLNVPNILAVTLKPLLSQARIIWGIRASDVDLSRYDRLSRLASLLEAQLSRFADSIISNSHAGKRHAVFSRFSSNKIVVIPNGIDTRRFQFDAAGRRKIRADWEIDDRHILIGVVARLDPMKDHETFLNAAALVASTHQDARFVCVGDGTRDYTNTLKLRAATLELNDRLIWAGARDNMPAVYSALDILVSSSAFGEGFSNTIAEAVSCKIPCIATDVGDSALIIGDAGSVIKPKNPTALADALRNMITLSPHDRRNFGNRGRDRIASEYDVEQLISRTTAVLSKN